MGGGLRFARPNRGVQCPRLARESCFPYGVVRRIRFEGLCDGSGRDLSPAPRAHLNEVRGRKPRSEPISTAKSRAAASGLLCPRAGAATQPRNKGIAVDWRDGGRAVLHGRWFPGDRGGFSRVKTPRIQLTATRSGGRRLAGRSHRGQHHHGNHDEPFDGLRASGGRLGSEAFLATAGAVWPDRGGCPRSARSPPAWRPR